VGERGRAETDADCQLTKAISWTTGIGVGGAIDRRLTDQRRKAGKGKGQMRRGTMLAK